MLIRNKKTGKEINMIDSRATELINRGSHIKISIPVKKQAIKKTKRQPKTKK